MPKSAIEVIYNDSEGNLLKAESFLDYLRPSHDRWHLSQPLEPEESISGFPMYVGKSQWVFRGHRDASWTLTPSAWRPSMRERVELEIKQGKLNGLTDEMISIGNFWLNTEASILRGFLQALEEFGHPVPKSKQRADFYHSPITEEFIEIVGLAQHHGLPTRLLDWTLNPLAAAYFAVAKQSRTDNQEEVCVWCLNLTSPLIYDDGSRSGFRRESAIKIRKQPPFTNQYLQAQKGLFTEVCLESLVSAYCDEHGKWPDITNLAEYFDKHGKWPDLETVLTESFQSLRDGLVSIASPTLRKVVLKQSEAERLLLLLQREGFNRSLLMPTLDNLAADVLEKWSKAREK